VLRVGVGAVSRNCDASYDQGTADRASNRVSVARGASGQGEQYKCEKYGFHFVSVAGLSACGAKSMDKSSTPSRIINPWNGRAEKPVMRVSAGQEVSRDRFR
jgi:hypothetical protein